ncbi:MAG: hypothetical protein BWY15_01482 [Firmicutes bacterium ADurb.Bin193]|nr:MAG: hypothetical protein BWY15_01482 [Firmicutes bacterium ADurb.Bin193]
MDDKKTRISKKEKIANDFLLQFAYAIAASIVLLFLYNARLFKYGDKIGAAMGTVMWVLFGVFFVGAAVAFALWKKNGRNTYKIAGIYLLATSAGFFWCEGVQKIAQFLRRFIPFLSYFNNTKRLMEMLFYIIGLSIVAGIGAYFYRINRCTVKRIKNTKKRHNKVR